MSTKNKNTVEKNFLDKNGKNSLHGFRKFFQLNISVEKLTQDNLFLKKKLYLLNVKLVYAHL